MRHLPQLAFLPLLALAAAACAGEPPEAASPAEPTFSEADRAAIEQVTADAIEIANTSRDWQAYVDLYYAQDASVHMPGAPSVTGREAIVESFAPFTDMSNMQFEQVEVDGSGDLAYVYGTASFDMPGEAGQPVTSHLRYVEVWERQADGSWKVIQDIANETAAAEGEATM